MGRASADLRRYGAHRMSVHANYGSSAGELAACLRAVGVAERSDLVRLELAGPARTVEHVVESLAGSAPAVGGAVYHGNVWWCSIEPGRCVAIAEPAAGGTLRDRIGRLATRHPGIQVHDLGARMAAIAIVGHRTPGVLAALGVYGETGDPRAVSPVTRSTLAGAEALWLLRSDHHALALIGHADFPAAWQAIHCAGERFGICAVGDEAFAHYALLARSHPEL